METKLTKAIGRLLPDRLACRATPVISVVDRLLTDTDSASQSQRLAAFAFAVRIAGALIAFVSQVLLARWLGSFEYGVFVAVWACVLVLGTLSGAGFPSAAIRFIAEYRERKQPDLQRGIIVFSLSVSFLVSTILAALGAWILYARPELVADPFVVPIYLAAICLPMLSTPGVLDGVGRAFNWPAIAFVPTYIIRPVSILLILGVGLMLGYPASANTAMWSTIIACYLTSAGQFFCVFKKLLKYLPTGKPKFRAKYWVFTALPMFLVEGFYYLQTSVDILFVSIMTRPEDTAIYYASTKVLALVHFVYFSVRAAVSHQYSALHTAGDIQAFDVFVQKTVTWTFWPSLLLAIFMMVFGKFFLMLFGPEYVAGQSLIWILALGIVIRASIGPAEALLTMSGNQTSCAGVYAATLFVNVALNLSLIPHYGLHGAAIATTCALTFESVALYSMARRCLGLHPFILPARSGNSKSERRADAS